MKARVKPLVSISILTFLMVTVICGLTGCFTSDKYHNKKHIDTIKKDLDAAHGDFDRAFGLDEPSPLVEK